MISSFLHDLRIGRFMRMLLLVLSVLVGSRQITTWFDDHLVQDVEANEEGHPPLPQFAHAGVRLDVVCLDTFLAQCGSAPALIRQMNSMANLVLVVSMLGTL